jgi:hypothetical protein
MHSLIQIILVVLVAGTTGVVSATIVYYINSLLFRRAGSRLETTFGIAGLVGVAMYFVGNAIGIQWLAVFSIALWGWVVLPVVLIPAMILWNIGVWSWRKITLYRK